MKNPMFPDSKNILRSPFLYAAISFLITVFSGQVLAQYNAYKPVTDISRAKSSFTAGAAKINSLSSAFEQEKILTALEEKIVSTGEFKFKRPDKLRIQYTSPYEYLLIMNGDKITVKDDQHVNQVNARSNKLFQQVNRIMIDCIKGTILDNKDFSVKLFEDGSTFLVELTPLSSGMRDFFATIVLIIEKDDYSLKQLRLNEPAGDQTVMTFRKKEINTPLADAVFTF
jgi:outer membrane lipoprotein-sorting protein